MMIDACMEKDYGSREGGGKKNGRVCARLPPPSSLPSGRLVFCGVNVLRVCMYVRDAILICTLFYATLHLLGYWISQVKKNSF
jgi:hypothetical protein